MKNIKIIRAKGNEADAAKEIADYLNRQGRIGNTTHAEFVASGDELLCTIFADGKRDDGRDISDIEDRKRVLIIRLEKGHEADAAALIEKFYEEQEAEGAAVSRVMVTPAAESVYFTVIAGISNQSEDDEDEDWDEDEDEDWDDSEDDEEDDEEDDFEDSDSEEGDSEDDDDFLGFTEV